jgi:AcrR family transcriptional regulator
MLIKYDPFQTFLQLPKAKRQILIECSIEEFAAHSFKGASLSNILRKAEIAKGSLYQYFKDKKHLYLYLVQNIINHKIDGLRQKIAENGDLFSYLRSFKQSELSPDPKQARFMLRVTSEDHIEEAQTIIREISDTFFLELIMNNKKILNPHLEPQVIAFVLTTLFTHFGKFLLKIKSSEREQIAYENLISILERGIRI